MTREDWDEEAHDWGHQVHADCAYMDDYTDLVVLQGTDHGSPGNYDVLIVKVPHGKLLPYMYEAKKT